MDKVAGHIPGAVNAPTTGNVSADGHFLPADELRQRFAALGADGSQPVGAYCGSGVTAAHEALALEIAGVDAPVRRLTPGLHGTVRGLGGLVRIPFEVLTVDEAAHSWSWRVAVGPVRLRLEHGVEARDGRAGTRTWLRTHGPAPLVWAYTPLAFVALQALVLPGVPRPR